MKKLAYSVIGIGGILALLILGQSTLIPFVLGIVLWYLSRFFKNVLHSIPFIREKVPNWLVNTLIFILIVSGLSIVSQIISTNVDTLLVSYERYQTNMDKVIDTVNSLLGIDVYENIASSLNDFNYREILSQLADTITGLFGNAVMVIIYALFIISEEASFSTKIQQLFSNPQEYQRVSSLVERINASVSDYIRLKTYVSLLTGVVGYIFLAIIGIDAPFFWAFLMFILNYIPTIGSLIATIFPAIFSLIQFGEITPFLIILIGLGAIEGIIGNVVEPKIMGSSLNLSPLVTILALVVWGQIWGITGMLLSVPITVVMVIIFSQFDSTRDIAILLSENGEIDDVS